MKKEAMIAGYPMLVNFERTFACVLYEQWQYVSRFWHSPNTRKNYMRMYIKVILPSIGAMPISDVSYDAANNAITYWATKEYWKEDTIANYRRLVRYVLEAAEIGSDYVSSLRGTEFSVVKAKDPAEKAEKQRLRIPRFLTVAQEIEMEQYLYQDEMQDGLKMGLLIMAELYSRNNETCALKYRDLVFKGCPVFTIMNSTVGDTDTLKPGAKSVNGTRMVTGTQRIYEFFMKRRRKIEEMLKTGEISFPKDGDIQCVDDMPMVCNGTNWFQHATSKQLTAAGEKLFKHLKMSESQLSMLLEQMEADRDDPVFGNFRDLTSYGLRRNGSNHLIDVGFTFTQTRYEFGHALENSEEYASMYNNEDQLKQRYEMREMKALTGKYFGKEFQYSLDNEQLFLHNAINSRIKIPFKVIGGRTLRVAIRSRDNTTPAKLKMRIESDADVQLKCIYYEHCVNVDPRRLGDPPVQVNTIHTYWRPYLNMLRKMDNMNPAENKDDDSDNAENS